MRYAIEGRFMMVKCPLIISPTPDIVAEMIEIHFSLYREEN